MHTREQSRWARALFLAPVVVLFASAVGCDKDKPTGTIAPPLDPAPSAVPPPAASTALAAPTAPSAEPAGSVPTALTTTTATATAARDAGKASSSIAALKPVSKHITGTNFALDVASPGCQVGSDCLMTIKLAVVGDYHVNKEYPYKFIGAPAAGVSFLGKSDANTFGRASGDFVEQGEKTALVTVRFKAASAGEAKVSGKYKLSVCSAAQCQIEEQAVELPVPVM